MEHGSSPTNYPGRTREGLAVGRRFETTAPEFTSEIVVVTRDGVPVRVKDVAKWL